MLVVVGMVLEPLDSFDQIPNSYVRRNHCWSLRRLLLSNNGNNVRATVSCDELPCQFALELGRSLLSVLYSVCFNRKFRGRIPKLQFGCFLTPLAYTPPKTSTNGLYGVLCNGEVRCSWETDFHLLTSLRATPKLWIHLSTFDRFRSPSPLPTSIRVFVFVAK